jgi:AraC-like DNA-binding protein
MSSPHAPRNPLPLLMGEGRRPDQEFSAFLRSAVSSIGPAVALVDGFSVKFGHTRFSCFRASPARIAFDSGQELRFVFPYQGHVQVQTDLGSDELVSGVDAGLYRGAVSEIVAPGNASFVWVEVDRQRLFNAAVSCQGIDQKVFFVRLEHALYARSIELRDGSVDFAGFRHYFRHLGYYVARESLGLSLGLEELFYRHVALLISHRDPFSRRSADVEDRERLQALQDVLHADPSKRFTLAEMSESVGISARALQKLVMSAYGVTPIEWQIGLRLDEARARLRRSERKVSMTTLSEDLGFSTPSRFTEQYRRKFGVSPSADLLRLRNRSAPNDNGESEGRNKDSP